MSFPSDLPCNRESCKHSWYDHGGWKEGTPYAANNIACRIAHCGCDGFQAPPEGSVMHDEDMWMCECWKQMAAYPHVSQCIHGYFWDYDGQRWIILNPSGGIRIIAP